MILDLFRASNPTDLILTLFTRLFTCALILPLHEFAHAWCAYKLGDDTAQRQGRMTINPIAHIDPMGMLCMLVVGLGWAKPVPVNPYRFDKKHTIRGGSALTSAAGPLSNFIAAFVMMILFQIFTCLESTQTQWAEYAVTGEINAAYVTVYIMQLFIQINIHLALFNLLPIPPLDGSAIFAFFFGNKFIGFMNRNQQMISVIFMIAILSGVLRVPLGFVGDFIYTGFRLATSWIPMILG